MAYSYVVYTGNGSTTQFAITFPYIRKEHVKVYVNYVDTAYTYVNDTTVQLAAAPASPLRVEVRRVTPLSTRLVDYTDGSTLVAADLDTSNLQSLYNEQELDDSLKQTVSIDPATGLPSAGGQRITNVGNPTSAQDAATKSYVDTADALKVNKAGDSMSGVLAMGGNKITGLGTPTVNTDSVNKLYVDQRYGELGVPGLTRWRKTATAGQTVFSGLGEYGGTLAYSANRESVFVNGAFQQRAIDYTADNGTSITITPALLAGDVVEVHCVNNVAGAVTDQSSGIYFTQSGTGATVRTVDSKLKDVVSVKDFGAVGNGVTNDTTAIQNAVAYIASVGGGTLFFPGGTYVLNTTVNVKNTASGGIFPAESTICFEGAGATKSTIYWLGGGSGLTGTAFDWGSGVYGFFSDLRFITGAVEGHTSQSIDGFTTSTSVFAGCSATSSTAIKHAYNGSFSVERCDFYGFHRAVWMDLGYNRSVRDCSMMFCNVGIGTYGAATINHYLNNRIERCAIGMSFAQTSTISCESNVTQANYAGCDVYIGTATHSLHFLRQYFEASPKAVFIQGGGTGNPTVTPSGHVFDECNSINITSQGRLNEIYLIRGLCTSVPIEHAGADAATYYAIDCYQHSGGARIPAVGYNMGVAALFESGFAKSAVPGSFGVGTNSPAGNYFARYATIESATYPGFGLRSTGAGGRMYSMGQDIVSSNGVLYWRDETANATRLLLDHTGRFAPGADNTQTLGSAGNRWSTVFAGTGTINTSDGRDKQDVSSLDDAEQQVALTLKGLIKKFRFKDAVQAKGDHARIHVGVITQEVIAAFEAEGLDPMQYGIVCHDTWDAELDADGNETRPAGDRYGIRYEELLAFIISAL